SIEHGEGLRPKASFLPPLYTIYYHFISVLNKEHVLWHDKNFQSSNNYEKTYKRHNALATRSRLIHCVWRWELFTTWRSLAQTVRTRSSDSRSRRQIVSKC